MGDVWSVEWPAPGTGSAGIDSADDGGQGRHGRRSRDERVRRNGASSRHGLGARRPALHRELVDVARALLLRARALADVPPVDLDAADGGMIEEVGELRLDVAPRAVRPEDAAFDRGSMAGDGAAERGRDRLQVVRMDVARGLLAEQVLGAMVEQPLDRRALVADHAFGVENRDHVGAVLDERAEALL